MLLDIFYDGVEIHREEKIIYAKFLIPHQVLSTCRSAGGLRDDIRCVYNHQSCEPAGHMLRLSQCVIRDPEGYRHRICEHYGLPAENCAALGTAANMNNACIEIRSFRKLIVAALCTGGVEANAGRAGDPASVVETAEGFEKIPPSAATPGPGTINTLLFISKPLAPGAMVRAVMTATEAKTAALQELAVNSRYSDGPATGTGTDQIAVASARTDDPPLTSAGKHAKLGELIGCSVLAAVKGALARQNNLTPAGQCSVRIHLERFGLTQRKMVENICRNLSEGQAELLRMNFYEIERDPLSVAAAAAMAHLKDKFSWSVLPITCWSEVMGTCAAQIACAVSGDYARMPDYRQLLAPTRVDNSNEALTNLACHALALGFADKWKEI